MANLGLRATRSGNLAAPPYTDAGGYTWDANLVLSGTIAASGTWTHSGDVTIEGDLLLRVILISEMQLRIK